MKTLYFIIFYYAALLGFSQNNVLFDAANALYNDGKYGEAIAKYESILESGEHSAALYFNLANANYKLNNIAPSVYYYEKARSLSPNDKDIQNNLVYAQNMTIDAIDTAPQVGFAKIVNDVVMAFTADTWALLAVVGVFIFVALFLMYHFALATTKKRMAFIVSAVGLLFACFSFAMAFQKEHIDDKDNPAIVFAQESRIMAEANKTSQEVFRLHEGTKVQVLESYEDWYKIQLSDNSTGWIVAEDLKFIKPI